jgi:hypothetical protein
MVVSPLLIPLGVHAAHVIANWKRERTLLTIVGRQRRAIGSGLMVKDRSPCLSGRCMNPTMANPARFGVAVP